MLRDFSDDSKQTLLSLVKEVDSEKLSNFTDWIGDRWYDFEALIGQLDIGKYINNVNSYHKKVIDKNNATENSINLIFDKVASVDNTYYNVFINIEELLGQWNNYIIEMQGIVSPSKGVFDSKHMEATLTNILRDIDKDEIDCLRDSMVKNIDGELIFDEEILYEYVKKNPAEMSDAEQALLIEVIAQLQDTVALYETVATLGSDELGVDLLNATAWVSDSNKYASFTGVSAHYNEIYVNLLNFMVETSEDSNTFAGELLKASNGESELKLLGVMGVGRTGDLFGGSSLTAYVAKYTSEHTEQYYKKLQLSENSSLKSSVKLKDFSKEGENWLKEETEKLFNNEEINEDFLDEKVYIDKDGKIINKKDAPTFYEKQATIAELNEQVAVSASLYDGTFAVGEKGSASVVLGEAEAHASIAGGFYVFGADGEKKFRPGVNAEIGASVTAFEFDWEQQWMGNEMLGLNTETGVTVGKAEAKADAEVQFLGNDGKLDIQVGASASAELIGGELEGSVGVNVLGGEVGVKGSVNYGIGAHADVGYRDGVFKVDVGASLGIGVSVGFEVDVGGMVNTVVDGATAALDAVADAWKKFWSW